MYISVLNAATETDANVLRDDLAAIERQPMSVRRQIKLFAALNPENQTPIEV